MDTRRKPPPDQAAENRPNKTGPKRKPCNHCGINKRCRPRGLCWPCYYQPGVKELYPIVHVAAIKGAGLVQLKRTCEPTQARPGTREKFEVLCRRAEEGAPLHNADDAPTPD